MLTTRLIQAKNPVGKDKEEAIAQGVGLWKYHNVAARSVRHTTQMEVEEVEVLGDHETKVKDNEEVAQHSEGPEHDAPISKGPERVLLQSNLKTRLDPRKMSYHKEVV